MLEVLLFTLAGREEHVAILAVHSAEGFLLVRILVGHIVWQEAAKNQMGQYRNQELYSFCSHKTAERLMLRLEFCAATLIDSD